MDSDEDKDLVARAKHGDQVAFGVLYSKFRPGLTRWCAHLLRNEQEGEQAAQDTFLQAWLELQSLRGEGEFEVWLKKIGTNVCLHLLRTKKGQDVRDRQSPDDPAVLAIVEEQQLKKEAKNPVADAVVTHLHAQRIVRRILECGRTGKPPWDALDIDIFVIYYTEGAETKREVAARIGVDENKVKYRIYHRIEPAIKKVRRELEAEEKAI